MHTCTQYEDDPSNGSCVIVRTSYFLLFIDLCDLWPHDPKIWSDHCHLSMHTCTKYDEDPPNGSWVIVRTSYFCLFIDLCDLWPLTSWPQNLIRSLSPQYVYMYQVWRQSVKRFLSYRENESGTDGSTYVRTDGQPENIMPPATLRGGGIKILLS